jgi:hypothetical protein
LAVRGQLRSFGHNGGPMTPKADTRRTGKRFGMSTAFKEHPTRMEALTILHVKRFSIEII